MSETGEASVPQQPEQQEPHDNKQLSLVERTGEFYDKLRSKRFFFTAVETPAVGVLAGLVTQSVEKGVVGALVGAGIGLFLDISSEKMEKRHQEKLARREARRATRLQGEEQRRKLNEPPQNQK